MTKTLSEDELSTVKVFKALGDPTRFGIIQMLTEREELGCGELQATFGLSAPALSHHTRVLQECGLIKMRKEGAAHFFRLRKERAARYLPLLVNRAPSQS